MSDKSIAFGVYNNDTVEKLTSLVCNTGSKTITVTDPNSSTVVYDESGRNIINIPATLRVQTDNLYNAQNCYIGGGIVIIRGRWQPVSAVSFTANTYTELFTLDLSMFEKFPSAYGTAVANVNNSAEICVAGLNTTVPGRVAVSFRQAVSVIAIDYIIVLNAQLKLT